MVFELVRKSHDRAIQSPRIGDNLGGIDRRKFLSHAPVSRVGESSKVIHELDAHGLNSSCVRHFDIVADRSCLARIAAPDRRTNRVSSRCRFASQRDTGRQFIPHFGANRAADLPYRITWESPCRTLAPLKSCFFFFFEWIAVKSHPRSKTP